MSRWFRVYDEILNDPKVLRLAPAMRWHWIAILAVASKNGGTLPKMEDVAFMLRTTLKQAETICSTLAQAELLDLVADDLYSPHNWKGRQFLSDSSVERVKRHRAKRAAAGLEAQWTAPKALRQAVYERDGFKCVYCGSGDRLSLDHRTPEIRGGTHDIENLATACLSCNGAKRDMTEHEYRVSVTLLKRPQSTEQSTEQKDAPAAIAAHSVSDPPATPEKQFFDQAQQTLGRGGRSLAAALLKAKGGNVALAHSALLMASQKSEPREYLGAIIRGRGDSPEDLRARGEAW